MQHKCQHCNVFFDTEDERKKYCTRHCYCAAKYKRYKQRGGKTKHVINLPCEICGVLIVYGSTKTKRFCSSRCFGVSRKKYLDIPSCLAGSSRKIDKHIGYVRVYCPMHPEANTWGYVYEHRVIAEKLIGRRLNDDEVVHHKNGIRWDNNPDNLEVMDKREHSRLKIPACESG
jgi:endogenous inhibitor of DNA gyrase (YacG/DUF329 family)